MSILYHYKINLNLYPINLQIHVYFTVWKCITNETGKIINKFFLAVKMQSYTRSTTMNVCLLSQNWKICQQILDCMLLLSPLLLLLSIYLPTNHPHMYLCGRDW